MINFEFIWKYLNNNKYNKIKFLSMNMEFSISEGKNISFEYKNNEKKFRSEMKEKIVLMNEQIKHTFIIIVKRHHDNYYKIFIDVEKEKIYSLEIIFYKNGLVNNQNYIEIGNKKIMTREIFPKTNRYNLVNINLNNAIKLYNKYANNKIDILIYICFISYFKCIIF